MNYYIKVMRDHAAIATITIVLGFVSIEILFSIFIVRISAEINVTGEIAAIEQLRLDSNKAIIEEGVTSQITLSNQKIKMNQEYRQHWWGRVFTPKAWEQVKIIELPEKSD